MEATNVASNKRVNRRVPAKQPEVRPQTTTWAGPVETTQKDRDVEMFWTLLPYVIEKYGMGFNHETVFKDIRKIINSANVYVKNWDKD